jgi:dihydroorotate dehydrogenase electron transfer subunit
VTGGRATRAARRDDRSNRRYSAVEPGAPGRAGADPRRSLAPPDRRSLTVLANEPLGAYRVLKLEDPLAASAMPGQFAMLAAAERWGGGDDERPYLARAFSIARARDGEAHYLLEDVGPGTRRLCGLHAGEQVWALAPLGRGFGPPAPGQRAVLVGGGVGIAPLAILQDALRGEHPWSAAVPGEESRTRPQTSVLLGFRDAACAAGAQLLRGARLASDDASVGRGGPVTELLEDELGDRRDTLVYACGPAPMLEATRALCARLGVAAQLALEAGMACGFGACHGCVQRRRGGGYLRVCVDGPVIDASELDSVDEHAGAPP